MILEIGGDEVIVERWVDPNDDWPWKTFDFNRVVDDRINSIRRVLISKAKEYATDGDRFHNFNVAARIAGTTPENALMGMRLKHEVSVMDLVEIAASRPWDLTVAMVEEKIGDNINYLILLEGMLKQRIQIMRDIDPELRGKPK
jgi:hypothetical protein